jgi:hypothetical protein
MILGLNAQTAGWGPDIGLEQGRAAQTGVRWLREEFTWSRVEPSNDAWQWSLYDTVVGEAAKRGLNILPMLLGAPAWASPSWNTIPADPSEFAEYAGQVAMRYGPGGSYWTAHPDIPAHPVTAIEIWNEPYLNAFSASGIDAARYARLVRAAAQTIHTANAQITVLAAGEKNDENNNDWISAMFTAVPDLASYFDAIAVHPYSGRWTPDYYTPPNSDWQFRRIEEIRARLLARGANDPLWITEVGWSTCPGGSSYECVSETAQATNTQRAVELARNYGYIAAFFLYSYHSWEDSPTNLEDWFGIVHLDGTPKPAYDTLRSLTGVAP